MQKGKEPLIYIIMKNHYLVFLCYIPSGMKDRKCFKSVYLHTSGYLCVALTNVRSVQALASFSPTKMINGLTLKKSVKQGKTDGLLNDLSQGGN